jgi:SAM-dependent methyltransferase
MPQSQLQKIREYWEEQARKYGTSQAASWADLLVNREIEVLARYLADQPEAVLDVGCANGHTSLELIRRCPIHLVGIDYASTMISYANAARELLQDGYKARVKFVEGDVLKLDFEDDRFDKVVSKRCITNLDTWELQQRAILEIRRVLRPGGFFLLSEPTVQGLERLNRLRSLFGLEPLQAPWHNLYLDEERLLALIEPHFSLVKVENFSSSYYVISRVIYPLLVGGKKERLRHDAWLNKVGVRMPSVGNFGVQKLFVMAKKG